jgi:thymidylate synthase
MSKLKNAIITIDLSKPIDKQYFKIVDHILKYGTVNRYSKGEVREITGFSIKFINLSNSLRGSQIFKSRHLPIKSLLKELDLYLEGCLDISRYPKWWSNWKSMQNSYPTYMRHINRNWRGNSRNELIYLGDDKSIANDGWQNPCISIVQFIRPTLSIYQRSCDFVLGGPCDIYQFGNLAVNHGLTEMQFAYGSLHIYTDHIEEVKIWKKNWKKNKKSIYKFKLLV